MYSIQNTLKTGLLLGVLTALLVGLGYLIGGFGGLIVFLVLAGVMNMGAYWFSDKLALRMAGAREVTPEEAPVLHRVVAEVASLAKLPKPRVYIVQNDQPNAFATGRDPKHAVVAATTGILDLLTERELRAVIAHEIGHVGNRDILIGSVVATVAGAITLIANILQWRMLFGGFGGRDRNPAGGILALVAIIVMPIAAAMVQMAISRTREFQADATGARTVHDPEALADALLKLQRGAMLRPMDVSPSAAHLWIVNPLSALRGDAMVNLFSTHPPIEERVRRLRAMAFQGY